MSHTKAQRHKGTKGGATQIFFEHEKAQVALLMRDTKKIDVFVFSLDRATLALREAKRHVAHIALSYLRVFVALCEESLSPLSVFPVSSVRDLSIT